MEKVLTEAEAAFVKESKKDVNYADPRALTIIGLDTEDGEEHYLYDPRIKLPLVEETIRNIKMYGVTMPVQVVRERTDDGGSRLLVIDGRQRVRMAREANRRLFEEGQPLAGIPYQVKAMGKEADGKILLSLALNAHRRNDDTMTIAEKALHAVVRGVPKLSVCNALGITPGTLERYTTIASECIKPVKDALREGTIGINQAFTLSKLSDGKQASTLKEMLATKAPQRVEDSGDGDGGSNEEGGNEGNEGGSNKNPPTRPERVKKEREGVSIVELRKGLLSSAADALPLGMFIALNWVTGNRAFEVTEEEKEAAEAALEILDEFLEKARIEAAQPKKRGRKPKSKEAAANVEPASGETETKIDEDFSGHVDPRLTDDDDGGALDGGPDWSSQFDEDAENDPRESEESDDE